MPFANVSIECRIKEKVWPEIHSTCKPLMYNMDITTKTQSVNACNQNGHEKCMGSKYTLAKEKRINFKNMCNYYSLWKNGQVNAYTFPKGVGN